MLGIFVPTFCHSQQFFFLHKNRFYTDHWIVNSLVTANCSLFIIYYHYYLKDFHHIFWEIPWIFVIRQCTRTSICKKYTEIKQDQKLQVKVNCTPFHFKRTNNQSKFSSMAHYLSSCTISMDSWKFNFSLGTHHIMHMDVQDIAVKSWKFLKDLEKRCHRCLQFYCPKYFISYSMQWDSPLCFPRFSCDSSWLHRYLWTSNKTNHSQNLRETLHINEIYNLLSN